MATEVIGEVTVTQEAERERISAECELAIKHLNTIVLTWEDGMREAPWDYIGRCEEALTDYENR